MSRRSTSQVSSLLEVSRLGGLNSSRVAPLIGLESRAIGCVFSSRLGTVEAVKERPRSLGPAGRRAAGGPPVLGLRDVTQRLWLLAPIGLLQILARGAPQMSPLRHVA